MRPARDELTPGEWAVLGLLDQRPAHGFAPARAMAPGGEFLIGRGQDTGSLLIGQQQFATAQARLLASAADSAVGYDRVLLVWRLHITRAVIHFTDAVLCDASTTTHVAADDLLSSRQA